jgi:CRISPR-associated endonuclease/helicase Cas3
VAIFGELEGRERKEVLLYHGRLTGGRRQKVYAELKRREKADEEYLLVTTSAIEVGCDLNAHTLITQFCNPEQLLQRVGRCNRRGEMTDACVVVVGERIPEYLTTVSEEVQEAYRATLTRLSRRALDTVAIQAHIVKQVNPDDRVEIAFRMLYEYVYDAAVENKPLHDKGLVFTRSWEPSLTLCTGFDDEGHTINAVQVSIERCATYDEEKLTPECYLFRRTFNRHDYGAVIEPLRYGGCAYLIDMVAEVPPEWYDEHMGYSELPKLFQRRWQRGYRKQFSRPVEAGKSLWLWYLAPREEV